MTGRFLVFSALAFFAACASRVQYTEKTSKDYGAHGKPEEIRILYQEPTEEYETLGLVNWSSAANPQKRKGPKLETALDDLRKKAWKEGGDAVIIRKQDFDPMERKSLQGEVIRFLN